MDDCNTEWYIPTINGHSSPPQGESGRTWLIASRVTEPDGSQGFKYIYSSLNLLMKIPEIFSINKFS